MGNSHKVSIGVSFSVLASAVAFVAACAVIGSGVYLYTTREARKQRAEEFGGAVVGIARWEYESDMEAARMECARVFGAASGNDVFERLAYLDKLFIFDDFRAIFAAVVNEMEHRKIDATIADVSQVLDLLGERAGSAPKVRFVAHLAANVDAFDTITPELQATAQGAPQAEYEGFNDDAPIAPKDTYYHSKIDPETGEPVSVKRSAQPGYEYAPQDPGADPGFSTRKVTPGY